jgi:amino acid adenylation domain-containing protein
MTLLAGFAVLLQRHCGQQDLVVGTAVAHRQRRELEDLIGLFVNTLALRLDLGGEPSFRELVRRVRETTRGAFSHQDLPFERLVEELHPERAPGRAPLVEVSFLLQNAPLPELRLPGLQLSGFRVEPPAARFELSVTLNEHAGGITGSFDYDADLFEPASIARMAAQYRRLLAAAAADPGCNIAELPLAGAEEMEALLAPFRRPWPDEPLPAAAPHRGRPPATAVERQLAALWAEALEQPAETVGVDEDLFARGADSLHAARLLARIQDTFGVELTIEALFDHPTLAAQAALLTGTAAPRGPLPPGPPGPAPLSFAQRRLWFLHQLDAANPVHNIAGTVDVTGTLDPAALAAALAALLRRHEPLRTRFAAHGAEPIQDVAPPSRLPLTEIDLRALPPQLADGEAEALGARIARVPFDLASGRLLRCALLRRRCGPQRLVIALHHIAADGWSLGVLLRELAVLHQAAARRLGSPLPALPVRYRDYAAWQRQTLRGAALAGLLAFWRRELEGAPANLELPADRPRPAVLSHRGAHHEDRLPGPLARRLAERAAAARATPFMALLAALAALLSRYTGQDDLPLGSPVAGRNRVELEGLIGVFINNLVLRLHTDADPVFPQLLARSRAATLAAYAHQDLPFELLVDELRLPRDLSRTPLFQILLVWQNAPLAPWTVPGEPPMVLVPREVDPGTARFDLALSAAPQADGWQLTYKYSTDLFDPSTVARLAGHLRHLIAAAVADPALPLSRLPLLGAAERHQLLCAWNDTATAYPAGLTLHQLIALQAARTPDAVAVIEGTAHLSYAGLARRAARLARRLRELGAGPESVIGIAAERSLDLMAGLVAILDSGAAYLPLDADHPAERLAFMLREAGAGLVLADRRSAAKLPSHAARQIDLEAALAGTAGADGADSTAGTAGDAGLDAALPTPAAPPPAQPLHPAYVIYTSGSTGRPKGVVVPHHGIVNRLLWMQETYRLDAADRVLQKTPISFDVSVWELFWPLAAGAALVMAPPGAHQDGAWLARLIAEHAVSTVHFVPSMLRLFLETPAVAGHCATLRRVVASGEALAFDLAERFFAVLGPTGAELHNLYGPTEASVDVSSERCAAGDDPGRRRLVPIGRPIANSRIHLLDRAGEPVPAGVPGPS